MAVTSALENNRKERDDNNETISIIKPQLNVDECRNVFHAHGHGGLNEIAMHKITKLCNQNTAFNVCADLQNFTGLTTDELYERLSRKGRFHFEGEHDFWNPKSKTELAWYYATSIDYLFANAFHEVVYGAMNILETKEYEPVLEYSAGVGSNVLYLANKGVKVQYFGIGMAEYKFAQYRVWKYGLNDFVEFIQPFSPRTGYKFDPINGPLPQDGSLGSIVAMDVLEHIPDYHIVVEAMVKSIRVGGIIIENAPFDPEVLDNDKDDVRIHVSNGGITMEQAMGPKMEKQTQKGVWKKIAE